MRCRPREQVQQEALLGLALTAERGPVSAGDALKLCLDLGRREQAKPHREAVPGGRAGEA